MALRDVTKRESVLAAIGEYDQVGRKAFLVKYGFGESRAYYLLHEGRQYDSKAIVGAAHGYQFPDQGPLTSRDFSGGADGAAGRLAALGFEVRVEDSPGQIATRFRNLAVAGIQGVTNRAPHKPLLALIVLRRLREGRARLATPQELASELQELLRRALPAVQAISPWEPIWRLEDSLWEVVDGEGEIRPEGSSKGDPKVAELRRPDVRCGLLEHVYDTLAEHPQWRERIESELAERFLSGLPKDVVEAASGRVHAMRRTWWVNQGQTYRAERLGGYIWAPQVAKSGTPLAHHTAVGMVKEGDIILHYATGHVRSIGVATSDGRPHDRPSELSEAQWDRAGLLANIEYHELAAPIALTEINLEDRIVTGGPFNSHGQVKQGYLFELPANFYKDFSMTFSERLPSAVGDPEIQQILCIYVGQSSEANLRHSRPDGRWGWKEHQPDYDMVKAGDLIILGSGYTGGSPRVSEEEFRRHQLRSLIVGRITRPIEEFAEPYWPDESGEVIYPFRLDFVEFETRSDVAIADLDEDFGAPVVDALRRSAIAQPRGILVASTRPTPPPKPTSLAQVVHDFAAALDSVGYRFGGDLHDEFVRTFVTSLATKRFLILTGLSGSGKTKIAQLFGQWLGADSSQIVAVRPDWTNPDPLLGYENGLSEQTEAGYAWHVPLALEFMLHAAHHPGTPHLLILDEMNLAHVERYFADVLSGMESQHPILPNLERQHGQWRRPPAGPDRLPLPDNLFVVGTVNVDETTYMFSPKVLDRANTMEFRVATGDLRLRAVATGELPEASSRLAAAFLAAARESVQTSGLEDVEAGLRDLHVILSEYDREFGHRTFAEALRFAALFNSIGPIDPLSALDIQVLQKVLPRFHGSIRELADPLSRVATWCFTGPGVSPPSDFDPVNPPTGVPALPRSFSKASRMLRRLRANHFVSFAE